MAQLRAALEAALRRLPIKEGEQWRVASAVDSLVLFAAQAHVASRELAAFRKIGREQCRREIGALVRAAEARDLRQAQRALDGLHAPVIDALARAGFLRQRLFMGTLPALAAAAMRAGVERTPQMQRRQRSAEDRFVADLSDLLAGIYVRLTGERPAVATRVIGSRPRRVGRPKRSPRGRPYSESYGDFFCLVARVFGIIGLQRSPVAAARGACARFRANMEPAAEGSPPPV
jgi:hypothetical protein